MKSPTLLLPAWNILLLSLSSLVVGFDENTCCVLASQKNAFVGDVPAPADQICGQNYLPGAPPAKPLYIDFRFCMSECPGIQLSKATTPSQWASPIVQFIIPSVIFSMTIPRRKSIDFSYLLDFKVHSQLQTKNSQLNYAIERVFYAAVFLFMMIPIIIDTMLWIFLIMVGAGNMIVAGLLEAHLDWRLVKYCKERQTDDTNDPTTKRELLTTIVSGNLQLQPEHGDPQKTIPVGLLTNNGTDAADAEEKSKSRLMNLLDAQANFGGAVGSPVLFFLGPFIYTILDLKQNPSSEDAAISLGFGIEWMNIVNVAIVSGCLLASNNPSTSAGIVGAKHEALESHSRSYQRTSTLEAISRSADSSQLPPHKRARKDYVHYLLGWSNTYDTEFQPVSLWSRGTNKMKWIKRSEAWKAEDGKANKEFRDAMAITPWGWIFKIFVPAILLVGFPPTLGAIVAYHFPPLGVGCRSLTFLTYGACQALISAIAVLRTRSQINGGPSQAGWGTKALYSTLWFISLLTAVWGTTFQIVGVFRNCFCYALVGSWLNIGRKNPHLMVATDTQMARDASKYWIMMGYVAVAFVGTVTYVAWWYQKIVRHRFQEAVRNIHTSSRSTTTPKIVTTRPRNSSMEHLLRPDSGNMGRDVSKLDLGNVPLATVPLSRQPSTVSQWSRNTWESFIPSSQYSVLGGSGRREDEVEMSPL